MAFGTALQDRLGTVARIAPQEDDLGSLAVVLSYRTNRQLRLASEEVLAIELEFPLGLSHLHRLGNRGEPDSAVLIDKQHPADEGNLRGKRLGIVVELLHKLDRLIPAFACLDQYKKSGTTTEDIFVDGR